jgi:hypothetical protein
MRTMLSGTRRIDESRRCVVKRGLGGGLSKVPGIEPRTATAQEE